MRRRVPFARPRLAATAPIVDPLGRRGGGERTAQVDGIGGGAAPTNSLDAHVLRQDGATVRLVP